MKISSSQIGWLIAVSILASCNQMKEEKKDSSSTFSKDSLLNYIKVLASDSFQGRKPFSPGETKTIDYLREKFTSLGLEPGNGQSYFQDVPMVEISCRSNIAGRIRERNFLPTKHKGLCGFN